ncbi:MAG: signal peptide peptidase SppA [Myxococcota bacterium]|nr:signal peptide peptidase SppA [Myxococcota bacterium]
MLILALLNLAHATPEGSARYLPPAANTAAEDGAASTWVNPANLGFDPDPSFGLWYTQDLQTAELRQFALASSTGNGSLGVFMNGNEDGEAWWGLTTGLSIALPENLKMGVNGTLNIPGQGAGTLGTWDVGLGYRPFPFLGLGAAVHNLGSASLHPLIETSYTAAMVVRPFGDLLELGAEYGRIDQEQSLLDTFGAQVRLRPIPGLVLRAEIDDSMAWGAGLEIYYDGAGFGGYVGQSLNSATGYLITGDPNERLSFSQNRVPVFELAQRFPYQPVTSLFSADPSESYLHLLDRLRDTASDPNVQGVVLEIENPSFNFAQVQELTEIILEIREADRPVIAWIGGEVDNAAYLLASACDEIHLHPAGELTVLGLSAQVRYLKGALDLVGAEPQFSRRSDYKSAVEAYTNTGASEAAAEQLKELLDTMQAELVAGISKHRGLDKEAVQALIDSGPLLAQEAIDGGLIDGLTYKSDLEEKLEETFEGSIELDDSYHTRTDTSGWAASKQIAIVYIEGPIVSGESTPGGLLSGVSTGSDTVVEALQQAADDPAVQAVVLRVDSPGGSSYASDEIWHAVRELQKEGKPVIVSMGGVAASGGYYVSASADAIYAEPTTITGSIGVYGGKLSLGGLYEKVGVTHEIHTRGRMAAMYSDVRPMDPLEFEALDKLVGDIYRQFKEKVAEGREMQPEAVEAVAQGRVWSGRAAVENGLVDELGSFQDAIERARVEAEIPEGAEVQLISYQNGRGLLGDVAPEIIRAQLEAQLPNGLPGAEWASLIRLADEPVLAMLPWLIEVK